MNALELPIAVRMIGPTVRALRVDQQMTRPDLAAAAGISQSTVFKIEEYSGQHRVSTIARLARALGISAAVFAHAYLAGSAADGWLAGEARFTAERAFVPQQAARRLGLLLRREREARRLSCRQLGGAIRMHKNQVSVLEVGQHRDPFLHTIARVAAALTPEAPAPTMADLLRAYAGEIDPDSHPLAIAGEIEM